MHPTALFPHLSNPTGAYDNSRSYGITIRMNTFEVDFEPVIASTQISKELSWAIIERLGPFTIGYNKIHIPVLIVIRCGYAFTTTIKATFRAVSLQNLEKVPVTLIFEQDVWDVWAIFKRLQANQVQIDIHIVIEIRRHH
jgi:hypothetical protein